MDEDEFLTRALISLEILQQIDFKVYGDEAIPSATDDLLTPLIGLYWEALPLQREMLRTSDCTWEPAKRAASVLATYAIRMAILAARSKFEADLVRGIISVVMAMDWCRSDPRDAGYYVVPLLAYSGRKIGANLDRLFDIGREVAVDPITQALMVLSKEYESPEILDTIGWAEYEGPAGIIFYPKGRPIPGSQIDL